MRINEIIDNNSTVIDEEEQGTPHGQKIVWDDKNNYFVRTREGEPPARVWGTAINKMVDDKYKKMVADDKYNKLNTPWNDPLSSRWGRWVTYTRDELRAAQEKKIGQASAIIAAHDAAHDAALSKEIRGALPTFPTKKIGN
jgi:hypothetical protein